MIVTKKGQKLADVIQKAIEDSVITFLVATVLLSVLAAWHYGRAVLRGLRPQGEFPPCEFARTGLRGPDAAPRNSKNEKSEQRCDAAERAKWHAGFISEEHAQVKGFRQ